MGKIKELYQLEDMIFQTMEGLYQAFDYGQKDKYKLALSSLELLNNEYKELTGRLFLDEVRILNYYKKMWEL